MGFILAFVLTLTPSNIGEAQGSVDTRALAHRACVQVYPGGRVEQAGPAIIFFGNEQLFIDTFCVAVYASGH